MNLNLGAHEQTMGTIAGARRAVAIERRAATSFQVDVVPLAALDALVEPWTALAAQAVEPNVFMEPAFALPATPVLGSDVRVGLIWSKSSPRELLGLFPVRIDQWRYGVPLRVLCGWVHPYAPFGIPLVHRDVAEPVLAAWLDHVAQDRSLPALLLLPFVCDDGGFAAVLDAVLARRGHAAMAFDRHQRALLQPHGERAGYIDRAIATKQRRELARKWRRLEDLGPTEIIRATEPNAVTAALDDFFRIEASGWKGRVGTAAAIDPCIRRFMTQAVTRLVMQNQAAIRCLKVDGRSIATAITLRSGQSAWGWKVAYDEDFARFSPGVQLLVRLTEDMLRDPGIAHIDSTATANHPMIDHIWRERRSMSDRLIAVKPHALPAPLLFQLEAARRSLRAAAKSVRARLRSRHRPANCLTRAGAAADE
jgi:CelD/BcsL family acetyltransferase involved in cellulose biosynthesis